jgi:hypothetical protein
MHQSKGGTGGSMKKLSSSKSLFCSSLLLIAATSAFAVDSKTEVAQIDSSAEAPDSHNAGPTINESSTTTVDDHGALSLDRFYLSYYGNLQGSRLQDLGSPYEANPTTGQPTKSAMTFASTATGAYMVTPDIGVGTYLEMNITPVLGQGYSWTDVGVTAFDKKIISRNGFTMYANAIAEIPVDTYDINRGMVAGLETTPYFRYEFPHSRFSAGAWTEVKNYTGVTSGKMFKTYWNPYVAYQINSHFSANLGYELEYDYFKNAQGMQVYETDLQPGILWFISSKFMLNPYIQLYTNNKITSDTAAFGLSVVARVL